MTILINNEAVKKILSPENIQKIKCSQKLAKKISEDLKKLTSGDTKLLREPYTE